MNHLLVETEITTLLDQTINEFFEDSIAHATKIHPSYRHLWEAMYGLIRSGGKRLRPRMTLMAYESFGGRDIAKVIPIAAAQELLHFSLLIHDDIIDRDYIRYGTPNVAGRYKTVYANYTTDPNEQTHYAHSAAILGGDLMLSGAHQLISLSHLPDAQKIIAARQLSQGVFDVAGGELLDTESSFVPYTSGDALKIAQYKTASYSFVCPLLTGALLAGATDIQTKALNTYAHSLGIAYQLVDDLLGVFGNEAETGKSTSSDILEGKKTYMVEQALSLMTASDKVVFDRAFGNSDASAEDIVVVKDLLISTGAREASEKMIDQHKAEALKALSHMELGEKYKEQFEQLIHKVTERSF